VKNTILPVPAIFPRNFIDNFLLFLLYVKRKNIIIVIKSRRMRWGGHVARMGEMRNA
jgi:hypothetical protein